MQDNSNKIFIVSAPSGTGKTTLTSRLVDEIDKLCFSISHTTRPIRKNEIDGKHYHFVDNKTFQHMVKNQQMVEWAEVHGNFYGTSKSTLDAILKKNQSPLLEIDVQGALNIMKIYPKSCSIFILPPSIETLWKRLQNRGTDSLETRINRLKTAKQELEVGNNFQHFVINDNLQKAYSDLHQLILYNQPVSLSQEDGLNCCKALIEELKQPNWLEKFQ